MFLEKEHVPKKPRCPRVNIRPTGVTQWRTRKMRKQMISFMASNPIGLVLRVFATNPADVENRVRMTRQCVQRAANIKVFGRPLFSRIDVLVWTDERFHQTDPCSGELKMVADCGQTAAALRAEFKDTSDVTVSEFNRGDMFCEMLNYALAMQATRKCRYTMVISPDAFEYVNTATMELIIEKASMGAKAVGVALNELTDSILRGRLANTYCMWETVSLLQVGGFDLRASKPRNDQEATFVKSWSREKDETVYYHQAGVEEVIPLARLVDTFGKCIAAIEPQGDVARYEAPDPVKQRELYDRHVSKLATKLARQGNHLASIDRDFDHIEGGLID